MTPTHIYLVEGLHFGVDEFLFGTVDNFYIYISKEELDIAHSLLIVIGEDIVFHGDLFTGKISLEEILNITKEYNDRNTE